MVVIEADGMMRFRNSELGKTKTIIRGEKYVESIECVPSVYRQLIAEQIKNAENTIIPCYKPEANSMMQALATIKKYYDDKDIKVIGTIEVENEQSEEGVVY